MDRETSERIKRGIEYERGRTGPPDGFPKLPDIPKGRYVDPGFFELEREHLWSKTWVMAGHTDQLPEPGSFFRWDISGPPVVVVKDRESRVRAFYNSCSHRGAAVVREERGCDRVFRCGYHGWTYDLTGKLIGLPDERDFVGLDRSCRGLTSLRCETWGGWIFVNRDPDAPSLMEYLGTIPREIDDFQVEKLRLVDVQHREIECNWKVAMDAFLETYHVKQIHPNSVANLLDHTGATMGLLPNGHSRMPTPVREERLADRQPGANELDIPSVGEIARITNLAYSVFPNLVTPLEPTGFPILLFWPLDLRRTRMDVLWFGADWGEGERPAIWDPFLVLFGKVLDEDTQFLPYIQKSMESPAFEGAPLNYQERRIYWVHENVDRLIGRERIPEHLRVTPLMDPWAES